MSDGPQSLSRAGELLRRVAQIVAVFEGTTPEVRVGDRDKLISLAHVVPGGLPSSISVMYSESDPVSLTVPLAGEDLDFIPLQDIADVRVEESLPPELIPFARAGRTLLCVRAGIPSESQDAPVVALSRVGNEWEEESAGKNLETFLAVLVDVLARLTAEAQQIAGTRDQQGVTTTLGIEIPPLKLVELEAAIQEIDAEHAEFWLTLLS